jgi:hypothetical protein
LWIALGESFFRGIEWFLIDLPEIIPLANAAPPPSATNKASAAMIVVGLFNVFTSAS